VLKGGVEIIPEVNAQIAQCASGGMCVMGELKWCRCCRFCCLWCVSKVR
jgi:hypothetical protein